MCIYNLLNIFKKRQTAEFNTYGDIQSHHITYEYSWKYFLTTSETSISRSQAKMHENWT